MEEKKTWDMKTFLREVGAILHHLDGTEVTEFNWKGADSSVKIQRRIGFPLPKTPQTASAAGKENLPSSPQGVVRVVSPVVGIFHFPDDRPRKGVMVREGKELGYVEAIRMKHPVEIEKPGNLADIHVSEGQPVEYGQLLFTLT